MPTSNSCMPGTRSLQLSSRALTLGASAGFLRVNITMWRSMVCLSGTGKQSVKRRPLPRASEPVGRGAGAGQVTACHHPQPRVDLGQLVGVEVVGGGELTLEEAGTE